MDTDVDKYLQTFQEKQEIHDFVNYGKYPERLKRNYVKHVHPKLDEYEYHVKEIQLHDYQLYTDTNNILQSLNNIELELKREIQRENKNECPICLEEIKEKNYVIPSCGHCLCIPCFVINIKVNQQTGTRCGLCRQSMI